MAAGGAALGKFSRYAEPGHSGLGDSLLKRGPEKYENMREAEAAGGEILDRAPLPAQGLRQPAPASHAVLPYASRQEAVTASEVTLLGHASPGCRSGARLRERNNQQAPKLGANDSPLLSPCAQPLPSVSASLSVQRRAQRTAKRPDGGALRGTPAPRCRPAGRRAAGGATAAAQRSQIEPRMPRRQ